MYRQTVFRRNGNQDPAARGTVELGHDKTSDAGDVAKDLDLGERILTDRGVEHQQNGMRHRGIDLFHHAHDLLELVHQHRLVLQAAGSVDEQHVHVLAARFGERVESEAGGVGARRARDHRRTAAAPPDVELVDSGRTEGIAGGEHHRAALGVELGGELADGGGLARAVDADDERNERLSLADQERLGHRGEDLLNLGGDDRFHLICRDRLVVTSIAHRRGDPGRALDAEIGADQHILDLVEHRLVESALGNEIGDGAADGRRRALETAAEPLPPALLLCRLIVHSLPVRSRSPW
jgi:hypothetical protein